MSSDIAIKIENLSKCYQIYDTPRDRLKQFIYPRVKKTLAPITRFVGKNSPLATRLLPRNHYKEFWALKDVSFEVKKGETVGIIGRNGSGKSTLLQMICGTLTPTSGSVQTFGRVAALLELGSGFNPEFTGRENVYMNAAILGLTTEEINARFDDILAFADIGEFVEQPIKTYSSGMMVRLAFAVIAHVDADILVVDEALAVGDAFFTQKCMRFLRKFMENGTVLFVSHDTAAVINLCQKAVWLEKGCSRFQGTPKEAAELYLAAMYEDQQGESVILPKTPKTSRTDKDISQLIDMRLDFINNSNLRNDIEIFKFNTEENSFGLGGAEILKASIMSPEGHHFSWVVGGELVVLKVECKAHKPLFSPIVGFILKDRLGQAIFADNTFLTYMNTPVNVQEGHMFEALFEFYMPILPTGDYSVGIAIAEGTQTDHIQHQWFHDALIIKAHASSAHHGLLGIPMNKIKLVTYDS